jgi:prolyl-tRNA synthetase
MYSRLRPLKKVKFSPRHFSQTIQYRNKHIDGRYRFSNFWIQPAGKAESDESGKVDSNDLLVKGSFVSQSHAGIFQLLPLGLRVQDKIERLLDQHMRSLGASKVALSSLSSEEIWRKSGRLQGDRSELFSLKDRKGTGFLLAPTHEEEITALVGSHVQSYRSLPLRLYQVTRKYRDEPRPRQGLLRTREFLMKDLYTFDRSKEEALETYKDVTKAYRRFFDEFKIPYLVAAADSGSIGGDLSHEYHVESSKGEDHVYKCEYCQHAVNEEKLQDEASLNVEEMTCKCPKCSKTMQGVKTIEFGHTFYFGTKYSKPLEATFFDKGTESQDSLENEARIPFEMGSHGIGVSRLIAGMADLLVDARGLNWPKVIAPFEAVVITGPGLDDDAAKIYDLLSNTAKVDSIIDDSWSKDLVWKMTNADTIGFPILVILGRAWKKHGKCEIQCRPLGVRQDVLPEDLPQFVQSLLARL